MGKKKFAALAMAAVLAAGLFGCPPKQEERVSLTPEQEALAVRQALRIVMIKADVTVADVNSNDVLDIYIVHTPKKKLSENRRTYLFALVTGVVVGTAESVDWEVDRVYLELGDVLYSALVSECVRCADDEEGAYMDACLKEIWQPVDEGWREGVF